MHHMLYIDVFEALLMLQLPALLWVRSQSELYGHELLVEEEWH
jgi:hypothetical protein